MNDSDIVYCTYQTGPCTTDETPDCEGHQTMTWEEAYERFDDFLGAAYGTTLKVAWFHYDTSQAIKELDPVAYRCEFNNWADSEGIDTDALIGVDREEN